MQDGLVCIGPRIMEVEMLIALNNHELKYFGRQLLITDPTHIKLQFKSPTIRRARYTTYAPLKGIILSKVNYARRKMEYLKGELEAITRSEDQEKFLFQKEIDLKLIITIIINLYIIIMANKVLR